MRTPSLLAAVLLTLSLALGQGTPTLRAIKIQIDANQWNRPKLLEKLNQQGSKQGMNFVLADEGKECDYLITFKTGQTSEVVVTRGTGGTYDYDTGFATVYDSRGQELFQVKNESFWSEAGATNGIAKEIIKRLKKLVGDGTQKSGIKSGEKAIEMPPPKLVTDEPTMTKPVGPQAGQGAIEKGVVSVSSIPDGADVHVDGDFVGNTPVMLKLTPGKHTIKLTATGMMPWTKELNMLSGSEVRLNATLEKEADK